MGLFQSLLTVYLGQQVVTDILSIAGLEPIIRGWYE